MPTLADTIKYTTQTHWKGTAWENPADTMAWHMHHYFAELMGAPYLSLIREQDIEGFKVWKLKDGCKPSTINKYLSVLSVLFDKANEMETQENERRKKLFKPLASMVTKPTIRRLKEQRVEKWWLPEEDFKNLISWLRSPTVAAPGSAMYDLRCHFADYLTVLVRQGLRPMEGLRLSVHHVTLGDGIKVPGTKTKDAEATIPMYASCRETFQRLLEGALKAGRYELFTLDYETARVLWNECRKYLGVEDIPTATLKALRRTFANEATKKGMPTAVLQKVLRHAGIDTTEGYLRLTGGGLVEESRKYMDEDGRSIPGPSRQQVWASMSLREAITAYKDTGATPEEVAAFTLALLKGN